MLSSFERLTPELVDSIAYFAVTLDLKGPPTIVLNLCLTSKKLNAILNFKNNTYLYARIFRIKFDISAPTRRLSNRWATSTCHAVELTKRFSVLKRIRSRASYSIEDLWTVYLMLLEGDGRNEIQLFDWAGFSLFLSSVIIKRMIPTSRGGSPSWFSDIHGTSLIVWLLWMSACRGQVEMETLKTRHLILDILQPFVAAGYRYVSTFVPDSYFYPPIDEDLDGDLYNHCPEVVTIKHYGHDLTVAVPPVTSAAALAMTVRWETEQVRQGLPESINNFPQNRQEAIATGRRGMTVEDARAFHYDVRVRVPERCQLYPMGVDLGEEDEVSEWRPTSVGSKRWDEDWSRVVSCCKPWVDSPLRGKVYTPGDLVGSWTGRIMLPGLNEHFDLLSNPMRPVNSVPIYHQGLYMTLREHHCLQPDDPLRVGEDETGGDDPLHAWLPRGFTVRQYEDAIEVLDRLIERSVRYETFNPGREEPYSHAACSKLQTDWTPDDCHEEVPGESCGGSGGGESTTYTEAVTKGAAASTCVSIDNDDAFEDTVSHRSSGVADILVTGETGERHGDAWGHYTIIGRVRSFDGRVALLRTPDVFLTYHVIFITAFKRG
ncbi:hypothetical protein HGRIS_000945 [Hohenbuehelia grisea]|uniref:Uncharacterized protein n=1 Tax=Hohenbuehelia grisea TaxID=104357 RepID=A0ABR3IQ86_9AGAR